MTLNRAFVVSQPGSHMTLEKSMVAYKIEGRASKNSCGSFRLVTSLSKLPCADCGLKLFKCFEMRGMVVRIK